jgi:hypothetical protein
MNVGRAARLTCVLVLCSRLTATAQVLPTDPVVLGNGLVTVGGDVSASLGPSDPGFFNYTDSSYSSLRRVRAGLTARVQTGDHVAFLSEVRAQTALDDEAGDRGSTDLFALYARIRPWTGRDVDIQIGRVPPTFGAFARRAYASDNPLIGYPLAYQYLTSLRPDALPATADDLLRMRGRGWLAHFPVGNLTDRRGVPLMTAFRWDTGIQAHAANDFIDVTGGVTLGTLANPVTTEDNDGRQFAGRLEVRPAAGVAIGASAAHGPFITRRAADAAGVAPRPFTQTAWGADAEISAGYYLLRAEAILSRWTVPTIAAPYIDRPLEAASVSVEARYKIRPGLYAAARADHLGFSTITGSSGPDTWDAPVTRVEVGGGYSLQRNLLLKLAYQYNRRDRTRQPTAHFTSAEVLFWF